MNLTPGVVARSKDFAPKKAEEQQNQVAPDPSQNADNVDTNPGNTGELPVVADKGVAHSPVSLSGEEDHQSQHETSTISDRAGAYQDSKSQLEPESDDDDIVLGGRSVITERSYHIRVAIDDQPIGSQQLPSPSKAIETVPTSADTSASLAGTPIPSSTGSVLVPSSDSQTSLQTTIKQSLILSSLQWLPEVDDKDSSQPVLESSFATSDVSEAQQEAVPELKIAIPKPRCYGNKPISMIAATTASRSRIECQTIAKPKCDCRSCECPRLRHVVLFGILMGCCLVIADRYVWRWCPVD